MSSGSHSDTRRPLTEAIRELSEIVRIVMASQAEQTRTQERMLRRDLRWRNIRAACLTIAILGGALMYSLGLQRILAPQKFTGAYAAMVRIEGLIDAERAANARKVNASLRAAFEDENAKGVVVLVNSPGGSPVQASLIHDRLLALRARHPQKPVWVVGEDMLTSGAYFIAVAAPHVCVDASTMTGSIGVVMQGFGLDRTIQRYDIQRRVITAGTHKSRLDAFQPLRSEDRAKATALLKAVHSHFISAVRAGRGSRLKGTPEELFSGDLWTGAEAVELGLVDGVCDLDMVLNDRLGVQQVKDYTVAPNLWMRIANSFGVAVEDRFTRMELDLVPRMLP
jgi:protease IV